MTTPNRGFVPIERASLEGLEEAAQRATEAAAAEQKALASLLELAEDLCAEAVRRLRERGAAEAQVERYEEAYRVQARAAKAAHARVEGALEEVLARAQELADV